MSKPSDYDGRGYDPPSETGSVRNSDDPDYEMVDEINYLRSELGSALDAYSTAETARWRALAGACELARQLPQWGTDLGVTLKNCHTWRDAFWGMGECYSQLAAWSRAWHACARRWRENAQQTDAAIELPACDGDCGTTGNAFERGCHACDMRETWKERAESAESRLAAAERELAEVRKKCSSMATEIDEYALGIGSIPLHRMAERVADWARKEQGK